MAPEQDDLIHVREYVGMLRQSGLGVAGFGVVGCLAALAVTALKTPVYQAEAELVLEQPGGARVFSPSMSPFTAADSTFLVTQTRVLESPFLVSLAADLILRRAGGSPAEELADAAPTNGPTRAAEGALPEGVAAYVAGRSADSLRSEIARGMIVGQVPKTRILTVQTQSTHAAFAAASAQALADAYAGYVTETFASSAQRTFLLLKRQADEAARGIKETATALLKFKKRSELDVMRRPGASNDTALGDDANGIRERLALNDPEIAALTEELFDVEQQIAGLSKRYGDQHPEMKDLRAKRDALQGRVERLNARAFARWEQKYLTEQNAVESSVLERELDATRHLHELLIAKMKEIDFSQEAPEATVRLLKAATVPSRPAYPRPAVNTVLGAVSGLLVGLLVAFIRAHFRSTMVSLGVSDDALPAPLIGRLPHVDDADVLADLLAGKATDSPAAEAFRALRTAVDALLKSAPTATVLITSPDRNDGKSTVAAILAHTFAKLGKRVLLADMDLRRGRLDRLFGVASREGLADMLRGRDDLAPTAMSPTFSFLPCGSVGDNPSELLASARMAQLMAGFTRQYDLVVLDSPPLLPVTDASLIARHACVRLMVLRSQRTGLEACRFSAGVLKNLGYPLSGVILNGIRAQETRYYGHYHRYYNRGYSDGREDDGAASSRRAQAAR